MQLNPFEKSILSNLKRLSRNAEQKSYLLAVSGGIDSMVLLNLFHKFQLNFEIAHCNFCLRGDESDQDEALVHQLANELGVPIHIKRFEKLKTLAGDNSIQSIARDLRYNWFDELITARKLDHLVLAHHADDNLETALYNFTKGTGIKGIKGMPEINGNIIRPLLRSEKTDIFNYANEQLIAYRNDSSNESTKYNRNLIRLKIIPELRKINPGISKTYTKHIALYTDAQSLIEHATESFKEKHTKKKHNSLHIDFEAIKNKPGNLNILLSILESFGFTYSQVKDIADKEYSLSGKKILSQTHELVYNRHELIISPIEINTYHILVTTIPICIITPFGSLVFERIDSGEIDIIKDTYIAYLKADTPLPFTIRTKKKGDIFYPSGMQGKKQKLKDYFINNKYSLPDKEKQLLLLSNDQVCWVVGRRVDERFREEDLVKGVVKVSWIPDFVNT